MMVGSTGFVVQLSQKMSVNIVGKLRVGGDLRADLHQNDIILV
jgi:hypothetical protein